MSETMYCITVSIILWSVALFWPERSLVLFCFRLRSNNSAKQKKLRPVSKPVVQRKQSASKQLYISSDDSSDSSTDTEDSDQESVKKSLDSKTGIKSAMAAAVHSNDFSHKFSGIKIKVSNPQKKSSAVLSSTTSAQFQVNSIYLQMKSHSLLSWFFC